MDARAALIVDAYQQREHLVRSFFSSEAHRIAELSGAMADRFAAGGRLLACGLGAAATDAQHVSVEFVHPVIVGKRALPAIALPNDLSTSSGFWITHPLDHIARHLSLIGQPDDMVIGIVQSAPAKEPVLQAIDRGAQIGMLPIALLGQGDEDLPGAHVFHVPCDDPFVVQEIHETLYHVLWELVHVFFEHRSTQSSSAGESDFLYPFLGGSRVEPSRVTADVAASAVAKAEDVIAMRNASARPDVLLGAADLIRERLEAGGKILVMGNGGSATDAQDFAVDALDPPEGLEPIPAISLTADAAVMTAVGNDVGFDNIFVRQVIAYGSENDVVMGISTSGGSRNVIAAVEEAKRKGALTVGLAGYGGGVLADVCDVALTVDGDHIPRLQEAQATQYHCLRRSIDRNRPDGTR